MPAQNPRYRVEAGASEESVQRALHDVSLDVDALETSLTAVPYTPGNSGDWTAPAPTNLQEAIDRIAAAIGPVP